MTLDPRYAAGEAARAADLAPVHLQRWMTAGIIQMRGPDKKFRSSGDPRGFSFRRVVQCAVANELSRVGIAASIAAEVALEFTDKPGPGREPCELFPIGRTLLVVGSRYEGRIVNVRGEASSVELVLELTAGNGNAAVIVDLGPIITRIKSVLGVPPVARAANG